MHANVYGTPLVPVSLVNIREEKKKPSPPQQPSEKDSIIYLP
jgi:hypothetical protein